MFRPDIAVLGPETTTERSETGASAVVTVAESFAVFASELDVETVAVLVIVVPAKLSRNFAVNVNCADPPGARGVGSEQDTDPPSPTAGVEQLKEGPVFCARETKV